MCIISGFWYAAVCVKVEKINTSNLVIRACRLMPKSQIYIVLILITDYFITFYILTCET